MPIRKGVVAIAIYHLSIKIFSRGKGASAVAKAAYRAAECIKSEYDGITSDYTHKTGVVHTEILLPENAPSEYKNRSVLWNAVEKSERYKTAQLAREIELSLPKELTREQNLFLVREYVKSQFVSKGMCADLCVHDKGDGNPHAHIMLTLRPIEKDGKWGQKSRTVDGVKIPAVDWNEPTNAEEWRGAWAETVNDFFEHHDHTDRIDHRSYERQGIDKIPTVHLGAAAHQMEQRGIKTERGNRNREIEISNNQLRQLKARINKLSKWVDDEVNSEKPLTLSDVIQQTLERKAQAGKSQYYQGINNLKTAAKMLNFLTDNKIKDVADLEGKIKAMHEKQNDLREKILPVERRLKTLDEHIWQAENYKKNKGIARKYEELHSEYKSAENGTGIGAKRKAEKSRIAANEYYDLHRSEMAMFSNAEKYLKDVLQAHFNPKKLPPITKWKVEHDKLTAQRSKLNEEYVSLKGEVKEVEQIRKSVHEILRDEPQERSHSKNYQAEL